jgi:hypothetical protein
VIWNERVLVIESEVVRRPAVGCIGWLDLSGGISLVFLKMDSLPQSAKQREQND